MLPVMFFFIKKVPISSPLLPTGAWHKFSGEKEYLVTSRVNAFCVSE